jgi:hypothetical protein
MKNGKKNSVTGDKIFGGMEPTEMDIMTIWRLRDYEIAVHPN